MEDQLERQTALLADDPRVELPGDRPVLDG
jgi:hypothetical protein